MPGAAASDLKINYADDTDLARMSLAELTAARDTPGADQAKLGPYEHRAFAREAAAQEPLKSAVSLPFAIPAYSAAKALGLTGKDAQTSPASFEEMKQGFIGLGEGLTGKYRPSAYGKIRR